jgi:hypothetical protein
MLNHARTILHNSVQLDDPCEEYVPPLFIPACIPYPLNQLWNLLYGTSPTPAARCFRTQQLMTLLHGSELEPFVMALDPRVTYWPKINTVWSPSPATLTPLAELHVPLNEFAEQHRALLFSAAKCSRVDDLYQVWTSTLDATVRMGAVVLALIYQLKELHQ